MYEQLWVKNRKVTPEELSPSLRHYFDLWCDTMTPYKGTMNMAVRGTGTSMLLRSTLAYADNDLPDASVMYTTHRQLWKMMRRLQQLESGNRDEDADEYLYLSQQLSQVYKYDPLCIDRFGATTDEGTLNVWEDVVIRRKEEGNFCTLLGLVDGWSPPQYIARHFEKHPRFWMVVDLDAGR